MCPEANTPPILRPDDIVAANVEAVRAQIKTLLQPGVKELVVDLTKAQMIDSMGIGLLIQAHNSLSKEGGSLVIQHASADLLDLLRSMRLDKRFRILE